mmetsp:Transcript_26053/g.42726  ORF Transcript_26053/g.42726 Transcript_26053/m.42726 type:complete len:96 (-) Transcript_26053:832-1119(-)
MSVMMIPPRIYDHLTFRRDERERLHRSYDVKKKLSIRGGANDTGFLRSSGVGIVKYCRYNFFDIGMSLRFLHRGGSSVRRDGCRRLVLLILGQGS